MSGARALFPGAYLARCSWLHGLDARVKLAALMLLSIAVFVAPGPLGLLPLGVVVLACIVSCHVPVGSIARALRPTLLTLAFVLLANGLVVDGSYGVQIVGPVGVNVAGLMRGARAVVRIVLLVSLVSLVCATTTVPQLSRALFSALRPLAQLGVPVGGIAMVVSVTLRFIPEIMGQFGRITLAQRARGARFDRGGPLRRLDAYAAVMIPLVVSLLKRGDELGRAMRDRGFTGEMSLAERSRLSARDRMALVVSLGLLALSIWL